MLLNRKQRRKNAGNPIAKVAQLYGNIEKAEAAGVLKSDPDAGIMHIAAPATWDQQNDTWKKNAALRFARYIDLKIHITKKEPINEIKIYDMAQFTGKHLATIDLQKEKVTLHV